MRKRIFALASLFLSLSLSACAAQQTPAVTTQPTPTATSVPAAADASDLVIGALSYKSAPSDVEAALGKPDRSEETTQPVDGKKRITYYYGVNTYSFVEADDSSSAFWLDSVEITSGSFSISRGIASGMSKDAVLAKYPSGYDGPYPSETESTILYTAGVAESSGGYTVILPPRGLSYGEGENKLEYMFPMEGYPEDMDPAEFVYQSHGTIIYGFDFNNKLISVQWSVGALAE